jgi:dihydrofolate reductase
MIESWLMCGRLGTGTGAWIMGRKCFHSMRPVTVVVFLSI